jgi:flagellar hook-associated protein 1 FlgK
LPIRAGSAITANGWTFAISGAPASGDTFTIPAANGAGTDNRNALALAGLQNQGLLTGGTTSVTTAYSTLVGQIGTQTKTATTAQTALQAVATQAAQRQQNISGVNLDEEGAKLVQWQQAYAAAGKVISVAASLFQTLLADIRG